MQLSYYNSSGLSEDLDAVSSFAAEFLCDPTHTIFISFRGFSHMKKENKQDTCFSLCSVVLHVLPVLVPAYCSGNSNVASLWGEYNRSFMSLSLTVVPILQWLFML